MTTVYADAYGFDPNDATNALQAAINDPNADKIIVRNMGTPWLTRDTIFLKSNKEIDFEPDVVIRPKSGALLSNIQPLFRALSLDNVKLVGQGVGVHQATLAMNKNEYIDPNNKNDYGHIIGIDGTNNYVVSGLTLTGAGGDGIIIDGAEYGNLASGLRTYSENGLIDNVTVDNNRRNGLSVISAKGLTVTNSKFINTSGTPPSTGIDFEPEYGYQRLENITVSNVDLSGNKGNGLSFIVSNLDNNSTPISIDINGATINNNESTGIKVGTYYTPAHPNSNSPDSTPNGVINISNVTIAGTKTTNTFDGEQNAAISIQALSGDTSDPNNLKVNFNKVAIGDTGSSRLSADPIFVQGFGGVGIDRNQIGNLAFNNVTVADNYNRPIIGIQLNQPGSINNITGNITGINPYGVFASITSTATQNNVTLTVTAASSPLVGTSGDNTFNPVKGAISIDGGAGNDTLVINNSTDTAATKIDYKTSTNGTITGGSNNGTTFKSIEGFNIATGSGNDTIDLSAATSSVRIDSGAGNDTIYGGSGDDTIVGGAGVDLLFGGTGKDRFVFNKPTDGIDKIGDFVFGVDRIDIVSAGFGGATAVGNVGVLDPTRFTLGSSATNSSQRFIYNGASGALFFDADGSGSNNAQVRIAQLVGNPVLTNDSFAIV